MYTIPIRCTAPTGLITCSKAMTGHESRVICWVPNWSEEPIWIRKEKGAREKGYPSPIHPNKAATDDAFNMAVRFCVDQHEDLASCNASHNAESAKLQAQLIHAKGIQKDHPHLNFCQLYGMSDHLTFNLADAGYNVAKYLPYGPVREVIPYLIRRAEENQAVTGDMGREMKMIMTEMRRRGM